MREIKAIVRADRLDHVIDALHAIPDLPGVTVSIVRGIGRRHNPAMPETAEFGEVSLAKLETVVPDDMVPVVTEAIQRAASTGRHGDGKIFVLPVDRAIHIRSGDQGSGVL